MFPTQTALWNLGLLSIWCAPGALAATVSLFPEGLSPGNDLRGEVVGTGGGLTTYVLSGLTAGIPFTVTVAEDASRVAENIAIPSLSILAHVGCVATGGGNAICEKVVGIGSGQSSTLTTVESFAPFPIAVTSAAAATTTTLTTTSSHISTTTASTTRPTSTTVSVSVTTSLSTSVSSVSASASGSTSAISTVTSSAVQSFTPTTSVSLATSTSPASTVSTAPATTSSSAATQIVFENTLLAQATAMFWSLLTIFTLSAI